MKHWKQQKSPKSLQWMLDIVLDFRWLRFFIIKHMNRCNSCMYTIDSIIVSCIQCDVSKDSIKQWFQGSVLKNKILCITLLGHLNAKQCCCIKFNLFLIVDEKNHCLCQKYWLRIPQDFALQFICINKEMNSSRLEGVFQIPKCLKE